MTRGRDLRDLMTRNLIETNGFAAIWRPGGQALRLAKGPQGL
jgi:hypothetical protein